MYYYTMSLIFINLKLSNEPLISSRSSIDSFLFKITGWEDVEPYSIKADDNSVIADVAVFRIKILIAFEESTASFKEVNKLEETAELEDLVAVKKSFMWETHRCSWQGEENIYWRK